MSTRATIWYSDENHIYIELLDNTIHIEHEKGGVLVDVEIMPFEKWVELGFPKKTTPPPIVDTHVHEWVNAYDDKIEKQCLLCDLVIMKPKES